MTRPNIVGSLISIKDNGRGMSPEYIKEILDSASSKKIQTNLGLPHAIKFLEKIGGRCDITSDIQKGTTVYISLPPCTPPFWCFKEYKAHYNELLIIIDDNKSIHDLWDEKFKRLHVEYQHFYNPKEALIFFERVINKNLVIFCDYEFFDEEQNGLDILEQAPINLIKVLVTSYV